MQAATTPIVVVPQANAQKQKTKQANVHPLVSLFAGSVGRTDLPGGDHPTMLRSLRDKVLTLRDDIVVLPGHGEQTSIARERASNPFLLDLVDDEMGRTAPVNRGL